MNKQKILNKIKERIDKEIKFFDKMDLITYIIKMKGKWKTGCKKKINTREGYYIANTDAPSYLQRFVDDYSGSTYGIESLVDVEHVDAQDLPVFEGSVVDYMYWHNVSTTNYRVNETPNWFRIDEDHRNMYMVESISYEE